MLRTGPNATADTQQPADTLDDIVPLAGVAAYATASALLDVPSGRAPGVWVVDNSAGGVAPPHPPSCVAFETDASSSLHAPPLIALMTTAHHFNDRAEATVKVLTAVPDTVLVRNGFGTPLYVPRASEPGAVTLTLSIGALPQYVLLPPDESP